MDEFLEHLGRPSWWLGVVIVGIAINLISAYLKPTLDRTVGGFFGWWRAIVQRGKSETAQLIDTLSRDPHAQVLYSQESIRLRLKGISFFLYMLGLLLLLYLSSGASTWLTAVLGLASGFCGIAAMRFVDRSWVAERMLEESRAVNNISKDKHRT